jgi:hypothetical protein
VVVRTSCNRWYTVLRIVASCGTVKEPSTWFPSEQLLLHRRQQPQYRILTTVFGKVYFRVADKVGGEWGAAYKGKFGEVNQEQSFEVIEARRPSKSLRARVHAMRSVDSPSRITPLWTISKSELIDVPSVRHSLWDPPLAKSPWSEIALREDADR